MRVLVVDDDPKLREYVHTGLVESGMQCETAADGEAALEMLRNDSRGAHFRADFPESGPLEQSAFTSARLNGDALEISMKPVAFTRVKPGESLLREAA